MLLKDHDKILECVFKMLDSNYLDNITEMYSEINTEKIMKYIKIGLHYPDLACGITTISKINNKIIFKNDFKTCSLFKLIKLFLPDIFEGDMLYQSHRGKWAIGHSCTPNPNYINQVIYIKILRYCLVLYYSCIKNIKKYNNYKKGFIYLGLLLHLIMDSYSPVHTVRYSQKKHISHCNNNNKNNNNKNNNNKNNNKLNIFQNIVNKNIFKSKLIEFHSKHNSTNIDIYNEKLLLFLETNLNDFLKLNNTQQKYIIEICYNILFLNDNLEKDNISLSNNSLQENINKWFKTFKKDRSNNNNKITNFQWIYNQSNECKIFHMHYDKLDTLKKKFGHLYNDMLIAIVVLQIVFLSTLEL